jgi:hypothetical protein
MFTDGDYPFFDLLWTMLMFFLFIIWIWILISIFVDLFRRHDAGGWKKFFWVLFLIVLPYLGAFIYIIANGRGMAERNVQQAEAQHKAFSKYVQDAAGSQDAASQIAKGKELLDSGAITQAEFEALKQRALAG